MAVIYADLRFTRTTFPPQTEAAPESPGDDWEVTYENVTPGGGKKGGAEGGPTRITEPTGVLARFPPPCVPITASVVVLVFLAVVITLATQLYRINHQHDETRKSLEELLQEHGLLNSTLTKNILTKESEARKVQETLRQTQMRLDDTRKDLQRGQDEAKTSQRRLQEKEGMEATMRQLREDLTKCKGDQNWATSKAEQSVATLRGSLARSEASLKTKTETLSAKEKEISSMKKTIQQTEDRLRWNQQQLQNLKESQSKTEAELSEMRNSMQQVQDELLESQRTSQLQLKKLSDAEQCFLNSCECGVSRVLLRGWGTCAHNTTCSPGSMGVQSMQSHRAVDWTAGGGAQV
ncbi:golgin subfamily A member 6-like protein 25 [Hyperolius riggenbachi]|uniref:golgin subfamily A member 6-like protein 25 n=1 Tax=Hyperolius riggenbachi TaxID=752182 RepID=UPI0035A2B738